MTVKALEVYDILKGIGLEEEKARKFVDYIEETNQERIEKEIKHFVTKEDLLATKENLVREIADVRRDVADVKVDLIKWMFIFWVGQVAVISGIIFAMLKLYFK